MKETGQLTVYLVSVGMKRGNIMATDSDIALFLASPAYGVAGASTNRDKYGNKVLRCYQQHGREVYGINPRATEIEGAPCVANVADLPDQVQSISVITPPVITEQVVAQASARGIRNIWMQPGAESAQAVAACREHGVNVIADGSCILVVLGYRDH
jgi:uncharacterized protein